MEKHRGQAVMNRDNYHVAEGNAEFALDSKLHSVENRLILHVRTDSRRRQELLTVLQ